MLGIFRVVPVLVCVYCITNILNNKACVHRVHTVYSSIKCENVAKSDTQNLRWKTESQKKKRAYWLNLRNPPLETVDLTGFF